ncbi:DUF1697 domain-containing protein [Microbacterium thalassium]|uniref:Uncharacterized protein (DUF1697 family) n=1 Tax=Microbacterium thalassium TaxID=362649 RepID=A0A7X0FM78_9MICO|nr:DUF1697 domain-containing protein [Microbacterium thalassium]MBB6390068.1 uncharacterized protein (DUF1697 family) [Microbacterium thalassium]GLK25176.1 hypothetical protein GCM10017607_24950 [Microbacterium thalassium]
MTTYLAFLRAINLGPTRKFPKDDIRRVVEDAGFEGVETHINTGNVRFDTGMRSRSRIEEKLEAAFLADRGFDVPTVAFTTDEFARVAAEAAELSADRPGLVRHYVYLLKDELPAERVAEVEAKRSDVGEMVVRGRAAHALMGEGYQGGQVDPLGAAPLLGVATNRNLNVVTAIAAKWC